MFPRMGRRSLFIFTSALLASCAAFAYVPTTTGDGIRVHWPQPGIQFAGNPINQSGLSEQSVRDAVVRSLQRWKAASGGAVSFDYWQGTNPAVYTPNSQLNGYSSIYFASNANAQTYLSPNILGLTQVWYRPDNGEIIETDIVLNDRSFRFTTNPSDTSGYGSASGGHSNAVFIENVLTHEIGHAYGLGHSGGLQSTMLFMESPEQAHLGCDEQVAIHALYPSGDAGSRGVISGHVQGPNGSPVFGAQVEAISRRRGTVLASAMTDRNGNYGIGALEAGAYFLMVEPYYAGSGALPAYYSSSSPLICPSGRLFSRTFLTDGSLNAIPVNAGSSAPTIVAECGSTSGAAVSSSTASASESSAPVIYTSGNGFGIADRFSSSDTTYYKLSGLQGHVEIRAMSYSLYSPIRPSVELLDSQGVVVANGSQSYQGDSGYVNYDSGLVADGLNGDYTLRVTGSAISQYLYPAGPISIDTNPFLLVTGSVNEGAPPLVSLPNDARCRMDENFPAYQSPAGDPPQHDVSINTGGNGGIGFCGTVENAANSGKGPGSPSAGAIFGWLLPWAMMAFGVRAMRFGRRRRRITQASIVA